VAEHPDETVADIRDRFVRRAEYLKTHAPFLAALDAAIDGWNATDSQFPLSKQRAWMPDDVSPDVPGCLCPLALTPYANPESSYLIDPTVYDYVSQERELTEGEECAAAWAQVWWEWHHLLERLWLVWWPPEHFPTWPLGDTAHPAQRFISACLLWKPNSIDADEWIENQPLRIGCTVHNISGVGELTPNAEEAYYRTVYDETMERLRSCVRAGEAITAQVIEREERAAHEVAEQARVQAIGSLVDRRYHYVWLWPGMTAADWNALKSAALGVANAPGKTRAAVPWKTTAHEMAARGTPVAKIAHELGVPRSSVIDALKRT
jgi:hypothetical protein